MRSKLFAVLLISVLLAACTQENEQKMQSLFNGTDFTNWAEPENNVWWKINDGVLSAQHGPEKKGSILWTEKAYTDFVLELEFKMGDGTVDSGVFLRTDKEQIQIGISGSLKRDMTCSPYISGKGYPVEAEGIAELLKEKDWNSMRIKAVGQNYTVWLNGKKVMAYTSETAVANGPIGLQLHGNREMDVHFRDIKLAEIAVMAK
ncbi:MAG: DUF1080 domain-containing protein [Calditrichaeota bacterium]|nr:MAG: DUF1080 domain-containing protein [Calditrichota bacterium]